MATWCGRPELSGLIAAERRSLRVTALEANSILKLRVEQQRRCYRAEVATRRSCWLRPTKLCKNLADDAVQGAISQEDHHAHASDSASQLTSLEQ